jgi:hypothetical protein
MSLEFRKIPDQESQASQLLNSTLAKQEPKQHLSRPRVLHRNPSTLQELPAQRHNASSVNTWNFSFLFVNIFNAGLQIDPDRNVQMDYLISVFHLW